MFFYCYLKLPIEALLNSAWLITIIILALDPTWTSLVSSYKMEEFMAKIFFLSLRSGGKGWFYLSWDQLLLNSGPGTSRAGPELALFSPGVCACVGHTLSSSAPNQPIKLKLGTQTNFRTNMRIQHSKIIFNSWSAVNSW